MTKCPRPGLKPGLLNPETSTLANMRPSCLSLWMDILVSNDLQWLQLLQVHQVFLVVLVGPRDCNQDKCKYMDCLQQKGHHLNKIPSRTLWDNSCRGWSASIKRWLLWLTKVQVSIIYASSGERLRFNICLKQGTPSIRDHLKQRKITS